MVALEARGGYSNWLRNHQLLARFRKVQGLRPTDWWPLTSGPEGRIVGDVGYYGRTLDLSADVEG